MRDGTSSPDSREINHWLEEPFPGEELRRAGKELPKVAPLTNESANKGGLTQGIMLINPEGEVLAWYDAGWVLNDRDRDDSHNFMRNV